MLKFFLIGLLTFPIITLAQRFERGSYQLANGTWQAADLRLRDDCTFLAKDATGTKVTLTPEQVYALRIGSRSYIVELVQVTEGLFGVAMRPRFVTVLDSGKVLLTYYEHYSPNKAVQQMLLRGPNDSQATPLHFNIITMCPELPYLLQPYVGNRPDLQQLLQQHKLTPDEIVALVHALNSDQPYMQPKARPPFGVD